MEALLWITALAFVAAGLWLDHRVTRRLIDDSEARIAEWRADLPEELLAVSTIGGRQRARGAVVGLGAGEAVAA